MCLLWLVFVSLCLSSIKSMWPSTDNTAAVGFALFGGECNYAHRSSRDVCYIIASCILTVVIFSTFLQWTNTLFLRHNLTCVQLSLALWLCVCFPSSDLLPFYKEGGEKKKTSFHVKKNASASL